MEIENASNPQWADAAHTVISLEVKFEAYPDPLPFGASMADPEAHGRALFLMAVNGDFGPIAEYVAPVIPLEVQLAMYERDLDAFFDAKAKELTFPNGRYALTSRAGYPNPWQALAIAFGQWMDACNQLAWEGKQAILAGTKTMPASKEAFLAELPEFVPPV